MQMQSYTPECKLVGNSFILFEKKVKSGARHRLLLCCILQGFTSGNSIEKEDKKYISASMLLSEWLLSLTHTWVVNHFSISRLLPCTQKEQESECRSHRWEEEAGEGLNVLRMLISSIGCKSNSAAWHLSSLLLPLPKGHTPLCWWRFYHNSGLTGH